MRNPYGPPTDRQLAYIKTIQDYLGLKPFTGDTKMEAMFWIAKYADLYKAILFDLQLIHEAHLDAIDARRDY